MTTTDCVRIACRALHTHALRSALAGLGIAVGVAAVIAMVAVGAGARARVAEQLGRLGSGLLHLQNGTVTAGGLRLPLGSLPSLTEDDARALEREIPAVQAAAPTVRRPVVAVFSEVNWSTVALGVTPEYFEVREWPMAEGRAIDAGDVAGASKVAVLGATVVEQIFGGVDPVGEGIRIGRLLFTVVGTLSPKGPDGSGQDQDDAILIPLSTLKRRVSAFSPARPRAVADILVKVQPGEDLAEATWQVRLLLRQRHGLRPEQGDDFRIRDFAEVLHAQAESSRILSWLLAAIAAVGLAVGGIGIMNIMLVSVTERTREIGLRMAVGARTRDIRGQFLAEAVVLSLAGGAAGVSLGVVTAHGLSAWAGWPTLVAPGAIILALGIAIGVGLGFGFYPAWRASRLEPIEALRFE